MVLTKDIECLRDWYGYYLRYCLVKKLTSFLKNYFVVIDKRFNNYSFGSASPPFHITIHAVSFLYWSGFVQTPSYSGVKNQVHSKEVL